MKDPNRIYNKQLFDGYNKSPELLGMRLARLFRTYKSQDDVAIHNDVVDDIERILGNSESDRVRFFKVITRQLLTISKEKSNDQRQAETK